jgi:hypothetical protein
VEAGVAAQAVQRAQLEVLTAAEAVLRSQMAEMAAHTAAVEGVRRKLITSAPVLIFGVEVAMAA